MDNPFDTPTSGAADWDSGLSANFQVVERGYHLTERAGQAISSGQVVTLNSGGFFFPYNPNSTAIVPAGYAYTAAASGDSLTALAWGIVRSLGINSPCVPGKMIFSTASGFLSTTTLGLSVGMGLSGYGILFNPIKTPVAGATLASLADVNTNGITDQSVLKWSNSASKWVIGVDSTGGGGSGINSMIAPLTVIKQQAVYSIGNNTFNDHIWVNSDIISDPLTTWSATSPTLIKVPSGYTQSRVTLYASWVSNGTGLRWNGLKYNGVDAQYDQRTAANESPSAFTTIYLPVSSGGYFTVVQAQTSGGNLNLTGTTSPVGTGVRAQFEWFP